MSTPVGTSVTVRDLQPGDLDAVIRIRDRSFGLGSRPHHEWRREAAATAAQGRYLGAFVDDVPVAAGRIRDFRQWWVGRSMPMAGVAGVVVAPECRGRGVGTALMRGLIGRSRELGYPISVLYPATLPIYRGVGYELAGARHRFTFDADAVRRLGGADVPMRPAEPHDAARLLELVAAVRGEARESGPLGWPEDEVQKWLAEDATFCYVAEDGFVAYTWEGSDLRVDELVAATPETARALWSTVGSGSSVARRVRAYLSPSDPVHLVLGREAEHDTSVERWMLRLVDAPAAIAARGWPLGTAAEVELTLDDPLLPDNAGHWLLTVSDGQGKLTAALDRGGLSLSSRGMAALYAGTPMAAFRVAGLVEGETRCGDGGLDALFAGPVPYTLDYF